MSVLQTVIAEIRELEAIRKAQLASGEQKRRGQVRERIRKLKIEAYYLWHPWPHDDWRLSSAAVDWCWRNQPWE